MTVTTHDNCLITGISDTISKQWCVYAHFSLADDPAQPPELIYVGSCRLTDVFNMDHARQNSDWITVHSSPRPIMVRVIATTPDRHEAQRYAVRYINALPTMPRCNLHGYNMHASARPLICSNGQTYRNQTDAAEKLGLSQSHISRHLRGQLDSVKGYTFTYAATRMKGDG